MRSPEGVDRWLEGGYREIEKPERLVFTHVWLDADRRPGKETLVTITLSERGGKTELTLRQTGFPSLESRDGHKYGWSSALDVLADYLAESFHPDRSIVITRLFDAPRNLVFDAWTNANKIVYLEIAKPERLVYDHGDPGEPGYFQTTVTFAEEAGKTRLTMRARFQSVEERETEVQKHSAIEGANQTLDRFGEGLRKMQELITTRIFDAPREVVFRAWTDPERLKRWWGPKNFTNPVCEVDVRPGGAIRIHMRAPDGVIYPMTGTFHEVVEPERLVFTSSALDNHGEPLFEILNTVTFAEEGGKTKLTLRATVSKVRGEAAPHLAGMEQGWSMTLDRLAEEVRM
jgi:uncharacterized protein YndB with AHSA1/START domain